MPGPAAKRLLASVALIAIVIIAGAIAVQRVTHDPQLPFLDSDAHISTAAHWITYPAPFAFTIHPGAPLEATFRKVVIISALPHRAVLRARFFRDGKVSINGQDTLLDRTGFDWKQSIAVEVTSKLKVGDNDMSVTVANSSGPPSVCLELELDGRSVGTDESWQASWAGATSTAAMRASSRDRPSSLDLHILSISPLRALLQRWPTIVLLGCIAAAAVWGLAAIKAQARASTLLFVVTAFGWATMMWNNGRWLDQWLGFDAPAHRAYIEYIADKHALPLADDGFMMYQPPLYYALTFGVLKLTNVGVRGESATLVIRIVQLALSITTLALVLTSLRILFPSQPRRWIVGFIVAAYLPVQLALFEFPGNEVLVTTLVTACIYVTLRLIRRQPATLRSYVVLGALLGAAMLTKFSALIPVAIITLTLLVLSIGEVRRTRAARPLAGVAAMIITCAFVCGWHYARVTAHFGKPFVSNWTHQHGSAWWQDPGYRTARDFLRFGDVLLRPIYNIGAGAWDQLYATLFGDALFSGVNPTIRPPWSLQLMAAGYLLSIVPAVLFLVGFVTIAGRELFRRVDPAWIVLIAIISCVVAAMIWFNLQVANYGSIKASYGLIALLPFCATIAVGFDIVADRSRWSVAALSLLLAVWALNSFATFWISPFSADAPFLKGARAITFDQAQSGQALVRSAANINPHARDVRIAMAEIAIGDKNFAEARRWLELVPGQVDTAERHFLLAALAFGLAQPSEGLAELDVSVDMNPNALNLQFQRALLLQSMGYRSQAITAFRQALRINPFMETIHARLAVLYQSAGETALASQHRRYAALLAARPLH